MKQLTKALMVAAEDLYKDATPKATQVMLFCLSDLTRSPNELEVPYLTGKIFTRPWPFHSHILAGLLLLKTIIV